MSQDIEFNVTRNQPMKAMNYMQRVGERNYMQRVGKSSCIRCEFETDEAQSFAEQDVAMMAHLAEKHPNWMTEPLTAEQQKALVERCMDPKDKRIVELERALAAKWISVKERMPDRPHRLQHFVYSEWVLIAQWLEHEKRYAIGCGVSDKLDHNGEHWCGAEGAKVSNVTHWQPLPAPPAVPPGTQTTGES